jgi:tetratricopeptide (TPR) repeat protein
LGQGETDRALQEIEKEPDTFWRLYGKCMVMYAMSNRKEADTLLKQLLKDWGDVAWPNIASVYAFRGEKDEAYKWLDLAYKNKDGSILEILNYPEMEHLWGDPRWNAFLDKLGLPKDNGFHRD